MVSVLQSVQATGYTAWGQPCNYWQNNLTKEIMCVPLGMTPISMWSPYGAGLNHDAWGNSCMLYKNSLTKEIRCFKPGELNATWYRYGQTCA